ncbi:MAG TPA: rhodanese-like domain-containing protein [Oligoflexia bacterium]|nr:rhodanese-like domain-containing protein [Oligoflexia bacterium]HMP27256.1 rhodanese-like domain-containing protein [Oligoflexia bacterium]
MSEQNNQTFYYTTFYHFFQLKSEQISLLSAALKKVAAEMNLRGLILLAPEGINGTVSAPTESALDSFKSFLKQIPYFCEIDFKDSRASTIGFKRFKVDLRREIVALGDSKVVPTKDDLCSSYLKADEWDSVLEEESDFLLIDARNKYEVALGYFKGAIDLGIDSFNEFKERFENLKIKPETKILTYCTGGIRCEKAAQLLKEQGYKNVFQLKGGILKYFEDTKRNHFLGECFVFDHRVAVDSSLRPSSRYKLCPHCGNPAAKKIECLKCGSQTTVCEDCVVSPNKQTCSKNCSYHLAKEKKGNLSLPL